MCGLTGFFVSTCRRGETLETILLQLVGLFMFSTDLTSQGWIFVGLVLVGLAAIVAWLLGRAVLVWKRIFKE